MSRGKTNNDFVFPFLGNAKLALKLANSRMDEPPSGGVVIAVRIGEGDDIENIEPHEDGKLFIVCSEDGEYMVNNKTIKWENVS
jgi:hypothetical protein